MDSGTEDLTLSRYGLRFLSPRAEADYRVWSIEDRLPAIRNGGWIAAVMWMIGILPAVLLFPDVGRPLIVPVYGIMIPAILAVLLGSFLKWVRPLMMPATSAVLCLSGFMAILLGVTTTGGLGGAAAGVMMAIFYAPFMRVTAGWSFLALTPPYLYCIYLVQQYSGSVFAGPDSAFYALFPLAALYTTVFINYMSDRRARFAYRNELIIERQKIALENTQNQIRRYLPPTVAEQIIGGNEAAIAEPKRQRITVLFADIVGFTDIADRVEPEVMTEVLNAYMSSMADLTEQHNGTLNEFAGDGIMALFGAPDPMIGEEQARSALTAAQAMQAQMPALNEQWRKLGLGAELATRIGINTGMVSVGSYGSQGRMTYTAIGLQTNIASRIESAAEPGQVLISDATYQLVRDEIDCEPKGEVECKGVHYPVKVYAPKSGEAV